MHAVDIIGMKMRYTTESYTPRFLPFKLVFQWLDKFACAKQRREMWLLEKQEVLQFLFLRKRFVYTAKYDPLFAMSMKTGLIVVPCRQQYCRLKLFCCVLENCLYTTRCRLISKQISLTDAVFKIVFYIGKV